jgi:RNA polymerase sigma factor (TIGR02999 family)
MLPGAGILAASSPSLRIPAPVLPTSIANPPTMEDSAGEITRLVERWSQGDDVALDRLVELVYDDLRRIARRQLRGAPGGETMGTTVLVHELYLKLAGVDEGSWGSRARFFAFCSTAMRRILIDHARRHRAMKRGGAAVHLPLADDSGLTDTESVELLALDEALELLATRNSRMAQIVECRFFGGLTVPETAEALGTSSRTVEREWSRARAYLHQVLASERLGIA